MKKAAVTVKKKRKSPVTRTKKVAAIVEEAGAADKQFREVWERLSKKGICDDIDGVEYTHVFGEWVDAKTPDTIAAFIQEHANEVPVAQ